MNRVVIQLYAVATPLEHPSEAAGNHGRPVKAMQDPGRPILQEVLPSLQTQAGPHIVKWALLGTSSDLEN